MEVYIKLTYAGTNTGPTFTLIDDEDDSYGSAFASGVAKATLLAGATYTVHDDTQNILIRSEGGVCEDVIFPVVMCTTTTTTTAEPTTTTTTIPPTTTTTTTRMVTLSWEHTNCFFDESGDSPTKTGHWNLIISPSLLEGESIALTISYELDNQSTDAAQQISNYSLSEGITTGNIIGAGNVDQDSLFTTSTLPTKTGSTNYNLTITDNELRLGLSASVDGDESTAGNVGASILSVTAIGSGVGVTAPVTNPSVIVYPNGTTEACPTITTTTTVA